MVKQGEQLRQRAEFVGLALREPKKAANKLRAYADQLESCITITDLTNVLGEIFFLSDRTIYNDLKKL